MWFSSDLKSSYGQVNMVGTINLVVKGALKDSNIKPIIGEDGRIILKCI
jgi:hypothetical protein